MLLRVQPPQSPILAYTTSTGIPGHWTDASIHRLDPQKLLGFLARTQLRGLVLAAIVVVAASLIPRLLFQLPMRQMTVIWIPSLVGLVLGNIISMFNIRTLWRKTELIVAEEGLLQRGGVLPTMEISRQEIRRIDLGRHAMTIRTARRFKAIRVFHQYEGFDALRDRLLAWKEIPASRPTAWRMARHFTPLTIAVVVALASMVLVFHGVLMWVNVAGLCLMVGENIVITVIFCRARELPPLQRVMIIFAGWMALPPMVMLTILRHGMH